MASAKRTRPGAIHGAGPSTLAAGDAYAARRRGERAVAHHLLVRGGRDERTHEGARIERRADLELREHARELLGEGVGERLLDEDPREARAALAGGGGDRERGFGDGEIELRVGADDHRVLAAELEREQLAGLVERGLGDRAPCRPRAGEEHAVDAGVQRDAPSDVGAALQDREHALG